MRLNQFLAIAVMLVLPGAGVFAQDAAADSAPAPEAKARDAAGDAAAAPAVMPPFNLQPRFVPGQYSEFEFWLRHRQVKSSRMGGQQGPSQSVEYEMEGSYSWSVLRVQPNGQASCAMTLEYIVARITANGETKVVDSRENNSDDERMHRLLKAMQGVPVQVEVAADGSVQNVRGVETIKQRAGDELKVPDARDFMETASELATLPGAPAAARVGDSWRGQFVWGRELGDVTQDLTYTLTSVEQIAGIPVANVQVEGRLAFTPDLSDLPPDAPPVDVKMTQGTYQSQVMFDLQRQEAVGRNTVETRQLEIRVNLPQGTVEQSISDQVQSQVLRVSAGDSTGG